MRDRTIVLAAVGGGFAVLGIAALAFSGTWLQLVDPARVGSAHHAVSTSMMPTILVGDYFVTLGIDPATVSRGTIVTYRNGKEDWISRIAGLPGDTIEVRGGVVLINGKAVAQRPAGNGPTLADGRKTRMAIERFPGETGAHRILDAGASQGDDAPPFKVPAGRFFLLSDNRDNAADSRFGPDVGGPGPVTGGQMIGRIASVFWARDRARIGKPLDLPAPSGR